MFQFETLLTKRFNRRILKTSLLGDGVGAFLVGFPPSKGAWDCATRHRGVMMAVSADRVLLVDPGPPHSAKAYGPKYWPFPGTFELMD